MPGLSLWIVEQGDRTAGIPRPGHARNRSEQRWTCLARFIPDRCGLRRRTIRKFLRGRWRGAVDALPGAHAATEARLEAARESAVVGGDYDHVASPRRRRCDLGGGALVGAEHLPVVDAHACGGEQDGDRPTGVVEKARRERAAIC